MGQAGGTSTGSELHSPLYEKQGDRVPNTSATDGTYLAFLYLFFVGDFAAEATQAVYGEI